MQFALAKSGMMKVCEGQWTVSAVEGKASSQALAAQGTLLYETTLTNSDKIARALQTFLCATPLGIAQYARGYYVHYTGPGCVLHDISKSP